MMIRVFARRDLPVMDIIELQGRVLITPEGLADAKALHDEKRAAKRAKREAATREAYSTADRRAQAVAGTDASEDDDETVSSTVSSKSSDADRSVDDDDSDARPAPDTEHHDPTQKGTQTRKVQLQRQHSTVVEVPLGHVEQDHLSEKRCTLCIDTLRVDGSRASYKHPLLVLKECGPARMRQLRRQLRRQHERARPQQEDKSGTRERSAAVASSSAADDFLEGVPQEPEALQHDTTPASDSSTMLFSEWLQRHPTALSLTSLFLGDITADKAEEKEGPLLDVGVSESGGGGSTSTLHDDTTHKRRREGTALEEGDVRDAARENTTAPPASPDGASAEVYKSYELIGVVRNSVLFNSKPARVFQ